MPAQASDSAPTRALTSRGARVGGDHGPTDAEVESRIGVALGRYLVLAEAGAGGMGVVLRAYDPKLRREVALKRLHPVRDPHDDGVRGLVREARSLARLSHPNVVPVYDVEEIEGQTYVVMEHVEGTTLRGWLDAGERHWREILAIFVQAAHGLAAAHAVGLIHRDFKLGNVLVGVDGRARVLDFGIARDILERSEEPWTAAGTVLGTAAYMAPEQHVGRVADARVDQYAWCVALWEALWRRRPFAGDPDELARAKLAGAPPVPSPSPVPRWLARVLVRGLSCKPRDRFADMAAMLVAIDRGRQRARWGLAAIAATSVLLAWAGYTQRQRTELAGRIASCEQEAASIEEAWNDAARTRLRDAFAAIPAAYAQGIATRVMPWLDAHAAAWREVRTEACLEARVYQRWDDDRLDRTLWCLEDRRAGFEALLDELAGADAQVLMRAVNAAATLPRSEPCGDEASLLALPSPPSEQREQVRSVRVELARVRALELAGRHDQGLELAEAALQRADALGWPPLAAAARVRLAGVLERSGRTEQAEQTLTAAYLIAAKAGDPELSADASIRLIGLAGASRGRSDAGLLWAELAEVELVRLGQTTGLRAAARMNNTGLVYMEAGSFAQAQALFEPAIEMLERELGPYHPDVAAALGNLASAHVGLGHYAEATSLAERSLAIKERTLGPDHPDVASTLSTLGGNAVASGDLERARAYFERAVAITGAVLPPEHPSLTESLNNLAGIEYVTGRPREAEVLFRRVLAIHERVLPAGHADLGVDLSNLCAALNGVGAYAEARTACERALAINEAARGPEHADVATSLANLAECATLNGDRDEARRLLQRALGIWERLLGPEHPDCALALRRLAEAELGTGRADDAVPLLERALSLQEQAGIGGVALALTRFTLARALAGSGGDPERAHELAQLAARALEDAGEAGAGPLAEVRSWLAAHSRR